MDVRDLNTEQDIVDEQIQDEAQDSQDHGLQVDDVEDVQSVEQRLADQFLQISEEFPDKFGRFSDLPQAVVKTALYERICLLDAYLRFAHREARQAQAERERQQQTAARSAGTMQGSQQTHAPEIDSFEQAFKSALR